MQQYTHRKTAAAPPGTVEVEGNSFFFQIYHLCFSVLNCTESVINCAAETLQFIELQLVLWH
jgi:hypothetical protein